MHNHNHNNSDSNSLMMWLMVLCCALPIIFLVLFSGKAISLSSWFIFGAMAIFLIIHFWMMKRSHNHSAESENNKEGGSDSRSSSSCH